MNNINLSQGVEQAWSMFTTFIPKLLAAAVIIVAGYFIAKLLCRALGMLLHKIGFERLVDRGGIKQALAGTQYDASTFLGKIVFYFIMLIALQFAFGVFGPNPIGDILNRLVAFLPSLFVAIFIVIVAAAVARAVKDILQAALGGLSYGRFLATLVSAFIIAVGAFAALNQLNIAPAIVNGLFYAMLAIIAGSAIVAIGGGGVVPMRAQWEKALRRIEQEAPRIRARTTEPAAPRAVQPGQTVAHPGDHRSFPE